MIDKFIIKVCEYFSTTKEILEQNNHSRLREYIMIRQFIWYFLREYTRMSYSELGRIFNKDHATCLYAVKTLAGYLEFDKKTIEDYKNLFSIAEISLSNRIKSVSRKFSLEEMVSLIELWSDEENSNDFLNFYKDNCDIELK